MTSKFWMGVLFGIATFAGLLLTTTVMFAVVKLGVFKRRSPIYLISTANMLCDCIQLVLAITYLVPSIICDSWLFEGERHNKFSQFLGAVFLFCWYYGSVAQILMAVNRFSFDHEYLSYSYTVKDDVPNYSNMYIDLPLNSSSSAICAACYFYVRFDYNTANARLSGSFRSSSTYALQFCAISVFYLCGWVTFRIFPVLIGARGVE
ncbi:unnamed protein product [Cylicostephanus goldi]|uniref:7TM GPCR serpentine receptor class x (Srx) domain-containing protein n=1 Tax=Cylicostephanus goldi TaxID=71465 RepID=A0A3P7MGJ6_CYLGO|nr:unnamed protein product [Cylicostephanus goldi]